MKVWKFGAWNEKLFASSPFVFELNEKRQNESVESVVDEARGTYSNTLRREILLTMIMIIIINK